MRFSFDWNDTSADDRPSSSPHAVRSSEVEWIPLHQHPVFKFAKASTDTSVDHGIFGCTPSRAQKNHLAWDGGSRLYSWDCRQQCFHCILLRLGDPDPASIFSASPSKVLQADKELNFEVNRVSINKNGSAALLIGSRVIHIIYLSGHSSSRHNAGVCRSVAVGLSIFSIGKSSIRILKAQWHPYSDTHVGILSSDSIFRIYDVSSSYEEPEQEYYLQPVECGSSYWSAASISPVDFTFGDHHLWDRFSVLILFADGSVYVLCPVVPFGSVHTRDSLLEIRDDARLFGQESGSEEAAMSSTRAVSWLEHTFPEWTRIDADVLSLTASPDTVPTASLSLQGPLRKVSPGTLNAKCEGQAVSLFHSGAGRDSILVTVWGSGRLQVDALADEIQPVWKLSGHSPRTRADSSGFAMICEFDPHPGEPAACLSRPPHLLTLAVVDLNLSKTAEPRPDVSVYFDPIIPEKMYCVHGGGIDSVVLHFLPFTCAGKGGGDGMRPPSVSPLLFTPEESATSAFSGFVPLSDSFGCSWIIAVTATECIVVETKTWDALLPPPPRADLHCGPSAAAEEEGRIMSGEVVGGPRGIVIPSESGLSSVPADSIDGREAIHAYSKLFHEIYVQYAHKVVLELEHHDRHVSRIVGDQVSRVDTVEEGMRIAAERQEEFGRRFEKAVSRHGLLCARLLKLRHLSAVMAMNPLSKMEEGFKRQLDVMIRVELHVLRSSAEALSGRLRRNGRQRRCRPKEDENGQEVLKKVRSSMERLSLINSDNAKKVKMVESYLARFEQA